MRRRPHYHFLSSYIFAFFPSFPRCIPLPLEPAFIIVTLSAFTFHHSPSVSKPASSLEFTISPSLPIPSNYPSQPPPPQINHLLPPLSTQPASKTLLIPAPNPPPTSIPPHHCQNTRILPPLDAKRKKAKRDGMPKHEA